MALSAADFQMGVADERETIIAFLRKYTHLKALAMLLECGIHHTSEEQIRDYAKKNGIGALKGHKVRK